MSDDNGPNVYIPFNFVGEWNILTQAQPKPKPQEESSGKREPPTGPRLRKVTIVRAELEQFNVKYDYANNPDKEPEDVTYTYDASTSSLINDEEDTVNISFWRNPSVDVIFSYAKDKLVWSASRNPQTIVAFDAEEGIEEFRENICRTWQIVATEGLQAARNWIQVRKLVGWPNLQTAESGTTSIGLFGLFHVGEKDEQPRGDDLYDILVWVPNTKCFNSVFGVRSLNYWPGRDCIFATFDCRFVLPTGHFGGPSLDPQLTVPHNLAKLLPHERELLTAARTAARSALDGEEPEPDPDPDTGVWVGEP